MVRGLSSGHSGEPIAAGRLALAPLHPIEFESLGVDYRTYQVKVKERCAMQTTSECLESFGKLCEDKAPAEDTNHPNRCVEPIGAGKPGSS